MSGPVRRPAAVQAHADDYPVPPDQPPADRFAVIDAMTAAAVALGWLPMLAESSDRQVTVSVRPPVD